MSEEERLVIGDLVVGTLRALHQRRIHVPKDIKVVGFDDIDETRFTTPTITTIRPDKPAIADTALTLLLDRMQGSNVKPRDARVGHQLIIRESTNAS